MFATLALILCIILSALGQFFMKVGMNQIPIIESLGRLFSPASIYQIVKNKNIFCGLFLYSVSTIFWLGALSTFDLSFMYPLASVVYVITGLMAFFFLGEAINRKRWLGILLVVLGCILITSSH
jgi:uncharacterized membrane protein